MVIRLLHQIVLAAFLCLAFPCFSQQDTVSAPGLVIKFSPQHLLLNGLQVGIEKRLPHNALQSIVISPHFYYGPTGFLNSWSDRHREENDQGKVKGFGADVQHRLYFQNRKEASSPMPYAAYSLSYSTFNIAFTKGDWFQELEGDGLYYYRYSSQRPFNEKVNRWGVAALAGIQGPFLSQNILLDLFVGLGFRYSNSTTNHSELRYNKSFLDFGYTGLQPLLGANFGYAF